MPSGMDAGSCPKSICGCGGAAEGTHTNNTNTTNTLNELPSPDPPHGGKGLGEEIEEECVVNMKIDPLFAIEEIFVPKDTYTINANRKGLGCVTPPNGPFETFTWNTIAKNAATIDVVEGVATS